MKNKENTSSILDNIRKKMQKIEEKKVSENIELGDEFEYIDKATKQSDAKKVANEIINDSKNQAAAEDGKAKPQEFVNESEGGDEIFATPLNGDDDKKLDEKHNFLYDNEAEEENLETPAVVSPEPQEKSQEKSQTKAQASPQPAAPDEADHLDDLDLELEGDAEHTDDLDLGELEDLEEDHHEDDLDLDDLDVENEEDTVATTQPQKPVQPAMPTAMPAAAAPLEHDPLEEELLAEEHHKEHHEDDFLEDHHEDDDLNLDENPTASTSAGPVVNSVYAATANEIISEIKSTDNKQNNMISGKVVEEATSSINKLMEQVAPKKPEVSYSAPQAAGTKTIEDLAREILQPQLEQWLNNNLTQIVERVVSEEIKKIIPKQ